MLANTTVGTILPHPDSTITIPRGSPFSFDTSTFACCLHVYNNYLYNQKKITPLFACPCLRRGKVLPQTPPADSTRPDSPPDEKFISFNACLVDGANYL